MITLFNKFKKKEKETPKDFKVGDYVYCYTIHNICKISKIGRDTKDRDVHFLEYCLDFDKYEMWYPVNMKNIIRHATPKEIEEYEIKKNIENIIYETFKNI